MVAPYLQPMAPIPTSMRPRGRLTPPIRCLLCDIYGTLLISGSGDLGMPALNDRTMNQLAQLLGRYGLDVAPDELLERRHRAIANAHDRARAQGIDFPEVRIERIWQSILPNVDTDAIRRFAVEFEMVVNPVWPMPHLEALLSVCRKRRIRLGIVSNAQFFTPWLFEWLTGRSLAALGFDDDLVVLSCRHGAAKPSDRIFQAALQRLARAGIEARQTAYIGNDMRKDVEPAARAGFQTILFAGDARSLRLDDRCEIIPDLIVTGLRELISYLF